MTTTTTSGGLRRVEWILRQPVDIFVLALGANDGLRGIEPTVSSANVTASPPSEQSCAACARPLRRRPPRSGARVGIIAGAARSLSQRRDRSRRGRHLRRQRAHVVAAWPSCGMARRQATFRSAGADRSYPWRRGLEKQAGIDRTNSVQSTVSKSKPGLAADRALNRSAGSFAKPPMPRRAVR